MDVAYVWAAWRLCRVGMRMVEIQEEILVSPGLEEVE